MPKRPNADTAASRLLAVLNKAKAANVNLRQNEVWAQVLGMRAGDVGAVLIGVGRICQLVEDARREVLALEVDHELYSRAFAEVLRALSGVSLEANWNSIGGR